MTQENTSTSQNVMFARRDDGSLYRVPDVGEIARDIVQSGMLDCKRHIWTNEQQTGHRVCAWCGYCDGGCGPGKSRWSNE